MKYNVDITEDSGELTCWEGIEGLITLGHKKIDGETHICMFTSDISTSEINLLIGALIEEQKMAIPAILVACASSITNDIMGTKGLERMDEDTWDDADEKNT